MLILQDGRHGSEMEDTRDTLEFQKLKVTISCSKAFSKDLSNL